MKNAITSSERKGILTVAGIALLVTAFGLLTSITRCGTLNMEEPQVEVLAIDSDSIMTEDNVEAAPDSTDVSDKKTRKKLNKETDNNPPGVKTKKEKERKVFKRRSRRDEDVTRSPGSR